ncbi:uncharacterized protein FFB14_03110 [Fusarium fujikuroi]|nr:uncharacterized protein FFB14_03110 [Fusarium fujikuroi]
MGIRKDRLFHKVISAKYILDVRLWKIGTDDGGVVTSKFLLLATFFRALCTRFLAVHGPTASNRPSCIELQAGWIFKAMVKIREEEIESIEPTLEAEKRWTEKLCRTHSNSLISDTRSWYDGSNIPGKMVEPSAFMDGFPLYRRTCYSALEDNFQGFKVQYR